jgi:Ca2+-binding RTX toxin-like protein
MLPPPNEADKSVFDGLNVDPIINKFNGISNLGNAVQSQNGTNPDNFLYGTDGTADADKIWSSPDPQGLPDNEPLVNNPVDGLAGSDLIYGINQDPSGNDETLNGGAGDDAIDGRAGNDVINGGPGNDFLYGGLGNDHLNGGTGADVLIGSYSVDFLDAGIDTDKDTIILEPGQPDVLTNFDIDDGDVIVFGDFAEALSTPATGLLHTGTDTTGADGDDVFFYNTATGDLYFDADGLGAGGTDDADKELIAFLPDKPDMSDANLFYDMDLLV